MRWTGGFPLCIRMGAFGIFVPLVLLVSEYVRAAPRIPFSRPDESLLRLLTTEDITRSDAYWAQVGVGGTIYDPRRDLIAPRFSFGGQFGRRFGRMGVFGNFELDRSVDLSQEVKQLDILHLGPGGEMLFLFGRLRSSISLGLALLNSDTDIDKKGKIGWYVDLRPIAVRWSLRDRGAIEFTPLSIDVSIPVTNGIPLILFAYFTSVSIEWSWMELQ